MKKELGLVVLFMLGTVVFAQSKVTSSNADIQKGIEFHDKAHTGDFSNVQTAVDLLKPYVDSDSVACAFYGSSLTLLASECAESNPIKSLDLLEQGAKFLDKAVKMDPENAAIRITRLENGIEVSRASPVKRYDVISSDVNFLLKADMSDWNKEAIAEALLYCGCYMLDAGDLEQALDLFDQTIEAATSSPAAEMAQKMLDKYSE